MNKRQLMVCAIALFCDGWSREQIASALGIDERYAQDLIEAGADAQAASTMGYMESCPAGKGWTVSARVDNGEILNKVKSVP